MADLLAIPMFKRCEPENNIHCEFCPAKSERRGACITTFSKERLLETVFTHYALITVLRANNKKLLQRNRELVTQRDKIAHLTHRDR